MVVSMVARLAAKGKTTTRIMASRLELQQRALVLRPRLQLPYRLESRRLKTIRAARVHTTGATIATPNTRRRSRCLTREGCEDC